jgi:16S rRNA processing protein RimM
VSGSASSPAPRRVAIGVVRKAVGCEGACAVAPFGSTLERISLPATVLIGSSESDCREIILEKVEFHAKGPVCFFSGIICRESAAEICGLFLFIDSALLPDPGEGSFYQFELVGMHVVTDRGSEIGMVVAVHNFPTIDSVEVGRSTGETVMLPLSGEALVEIDRRNNRLTVRHSFIEELL